MLVLSRKRNQEILIGDEIRLTVVEIRGDKVRLGIAAPPEVEVDRREVREAKRRGVPVVEMIAGTRRVNPDAPVAVG